ncbi:GGDEF domain-containing protein [Phyllobacterium meliloti]|uniref:GGDEF domain-containing protein n=1 Tax=Phyllobacterium meliloti TaxID=555317 RepID=UPI001D154C16|nr:GGDEF domain-containing protein [Phyllobacterium sp. T1293]UGX87039.1 GGDEF domain-containing protein [Phyllobacterium sp. T1293]
MSNLLFEWFTTASPRQSRAVEQRLIETMLLRRAALFFGSISIVALATYARSVTQSNWPFVWIIIELVLLVIRQHLLTLGEEAKSETDPRIFSYLMLAGGLWSLVAGVGCAFCVVTGNFTLSMMAAMNVAGIQGVIASRNAAIPRYAVLVLILVGLPFLVGLYLSPIPDAGYLCLLLPVWTAGMCFVLYQNYQLNVRAIQTEILNQFLATNDALTGLPNRMALDGKLEALCSQLSLDETDEKRWFSLLYIDLDGFKAVNDNCGHAAGDIVLQKVGAAITGAVRAKDTVFRIGGDEFVVLLPDRSDQDYVELVERIQEAVAYSFDLGHGRFAQVSASIGSAQAPQHGTSPEAILLAADKALYAAKNEGEGLHRMSS